MFLRNLHHVIWVLSHASDKQCCSRQQSERPNENETSELLHTQSKNLTSIHTIVTKKANRKMIRQLQYRGKRDEKVKTQKI